MKIRLLNYYCNSQIFNHDVGLKMTSIIKTITLTILSFSLGACVIPVSNKSTISPEHIVITGIDTEVVSPVIVDLTRHQAHNPNAPVYLCTLKPFTQTFQSENTSRGKAKLDVQKQCRAQFNAMFCEEKDIVCTLYD